MTVSIRSHQSNAQNGCKCSGASAMVRSKKTSQGYARKRTLKPGGSFICGGGGL
jgi:hypothetical protein